MTTPKLPILSFRPTSHQWTLHVPQTELQRLGNKELSVRFGAEKKSQKVALSTSSPQADSIASKVRVIQRQGGLSVGPFIGILTMSRGSEFKGNKNNYMDIIQTARQLGAFVYVFTVEDINWNNRTTKAFLYDPKVGWAKTTDLPLPDVVYNRIPYREDEMKDYVQTTLKRLQSMPNLQLYNNHFFNKWNLYETLGKNPRVADYIPESQKLSSRREFYYMLNKYSLLYLKPISGKAGKGIMRLESDQGIYTLKIRQGNKTIGKRYQDATALWNEIKSKVSTGYVVQEGITLLTYQGRPFDIRVLVQKDGTGTWKPSGVGIRVAGKNSITTHVPRGGSIASPDAVLKKIMNDSEYAAFMERLRRTVLELASSLEEAYPSLGEFSMDLGLTKDKKLWFFEANAKPMKFDEPHIRKTSLERIVQYAQYLSNFSPKGETTRGN
ncbi:YheC/YheD family protein [Ammoniphilus sp. CFH 90114]|uniref:YheC/YheD family endospore coat-associated protein n=1 Tax=Ammoniphilus sp. CFH 90114 TaxID=2493665 RepID=UPI00100F7130|nr:YheC/YheD family protein [Ammoniphilus sp. CFH 90114]RXT04809.1 YheC/YheD family protein [Ammoniphilus sp. CFH 90114]